MIWAPAVQVPRPRLRQANEALRADSSQGASPFLNLLPAVEKVHEASVRLERRIAALRCLEGVRLHADANNGKLPATLADVHLVPVPSDPATSKQFLYRADGDRVTLRDPPFDDQQPALSTPLHYEMTFRR